MSSRLSDAVRRLPVLSRPRRRRVTKAANGLPTAAGEGSGRPDVVGAAHRAAEPPRGGRAVMSGRWLEEHGFAIGSGVHVLVEQGRVTLISCR